MEDLETNIKTNNTSVQVTTQNWKTEFEAFKYDIQNQQEIYHDIFKRHLYDEINEKINEINQIFNKIQGQCQNDIDDVKSEMRLGFYNIWTDLSKQELYAKRKEKEYKRRIWLQGRKRRK